MQDNPIPLDMLFKRTSKEKIAPLVEKSSLISMYEIEDDSVIYTKETSSGEIIAYLIGRYLPAKRIFPAPPKPLHPNDMVFYIDIMEVNRRHRHKGYGTDLFHYVTTLFREDNILLMGTRFSKNFWRNQKGHMEIKEFGQSVYFLFPKEEKISA